MSGKSDYILEFKNITKTFPGVKALNDVTFGILPGTVHVLIGENGAGKSTLFKVINGLYKAEVGQVFFEGQALETNGPSDSLKKGISMIYQELNVIPEMTVLENMFLGRELLTPTGLVDYGRMEKEAKEYLKEQGLSFNLKSKMKELSIAEAQMLEIVKSISANAKVILMDEPTSSLTEKEVDFLFKKIKELRDRGITIIYVSHKMEEIFEIGEYISVLRDGQHIHTGLVSETNVADVIEKMVGRKMDEVYPENNNQIKNVIFSVKNFSKKGVFEGINFDVKAGEIFGISGLIGAGRTEIARAIMGMDLKDTGEVYLDGELLKIKTVNDAISKGIVMVPEDRKRLGLNLIGTVEANLTLVSLAHVFKTYVLKLKGMKELVKRMMEHLRIKAPGPRTIVQTLSGGNQQKVVLGKWLSVDPKVLFLDEPTRGIDVGTKYEIYKLMRDLCSKGNAIVLIDSDLNELIGMSDRVMVIHEGKQAGILNKDEINANRIMHLAAVGGEL